MTIGKCVFSFWETGPSDKGPQNNSGCLEEMATSQPGFYCEIYLCLVKLQLCREIVLHCIMTIGKCMFSVWEPGPSDKFGPQNKSGCLDEMDTS